MKYNKLQYRNASLTQNLQQHLPRMTTRIISRSGCNVLHVPSNMKSNNNISRSCIRKYNALIPTRPMTRQQLFESYQQHSFFRTTSPDYSCSKMILPSTFNVQSTSLNAFLSTTTGSTVPGTDNQDINTDTSTSSINEEKISLLSSSTKSKSSDHIDDQDGTNSGSNILVLFERNELHPDAIQTTTLMRAGFVFSSCHTLYWIWYTFDFIPYVNKAAMEVLHVDPMIGVFGIVFALSLQSAFIVYPLRLISKLTYKMDEQRICVYTHRLPSMYPSVRRPYVTYPLGTPNTAHNAEMIRNQALLKPSSNEDISSLQEKAKSTAAQIVTKNIKYFSLDTTTPTALNLIQGESQGDLSKYRGHLLLGPGWPKYVLDIKESQEVKQAAYLLQALIKPEHFYFKRSDRNKISIDDHDGSNSNTVSRKSINPFQLRVKSRQQHAISSSSIRKSKHRKKRR